jgi:hypothetical protein
MVDFKIIIIGVIILLFLYIIITYIFSNRKIIKNTIVQSDASDSNKIINTDKIAVKSGVTDFTISFWLYVDKYGTNGSNDFNIIEKYTKNGTQIFKIAGDPNKNDIHFYLHTSTDKHLRSSRLTLENIYLQRWINIIMTVETRNLDIYLNGKLEETIILDSLPNSKTNGKNCEFKLFNHLNSSSLIQMKLSNAQYLTRSVAPREAWSIYKEGYRNFGLFGYLFSLLGGYQVDFTFKKNGERITDFSLGG